MAFKTRVKSNNPDNLNIADCIKQESTNKVKALKRYASKRAEIQVRKRTANKEVDRKICVSSCDHSYCKYNFISQSGQSASKMFYPPCPQYYPMTTNAWSPVIPIQGPLYTVQPIPVVVNSSFLSTQIYPYPPIIVPPVTMASSLVSVNEFEQHMDGISPIVTSIPNEQTCCEMSSTEHFSNGFSNLALCNEMIFPGTPLKSISSFILSDDVTSVALTPNVSPLFAFNSCEISPIETLLTDIFSPIQNIQVPNEFIPFCTTVTDEVSPLSIYNYETFPYEYFECELPVVDESVHEAEVQEYQHNVDNPLEFYLSLPKDLFPPARMITMDPNSIIDEFCRALSMDDHSWILDLEFGIPKTPVTRRVATYNVKLNSITCKNVPEAIHPGFESCDKDLKRALMFYYDCVISNWYRGYIALSCDRSVENFQSWLSLPMQVLGMCWA